MNILVILIPCVPHFGVAWDWPPFYGQCALINTTMTKANAARILLDD